MGKRTTSTPPVDLFRSLVEQQVMGLLVLDHHFVIRYASAPCAPILARTPDSLVGQSALDLIHSDELGGLRESVARARAAPGTHIPVQNRFRHGDAGWRELEGTVLCLVGDPPVDGLVLFIQEASDRHGERRALLENEVRFREAAENAPVMIWAADAAHAVTWENRTTLDFVGRTLAEEAGDGWLSEVHPGDRLRLEECYRVSVAEQRGFTLEFRLRRHDGVYRQIMQIVIPRRDESGLSGFLGVDVDVTDLKERGLALEEAEARYQQIAETVPVIVWIDDAAHQLTYHNRTAEAFFGRNIANGADTAWSDEIHPDDRPRVLGTYYATIANPAPYQEKYRLRRADGAYRWMIEIGVPRYSTEGQFTGFVGVDVEIHDLMEASNRLEEAEARYRNFIEHSTEGIWRLEAEKPIAIALPEDEQIRLILDHTILAESNVAMAAMYGYERPEQMVGRKVREFAGPHSARMAEVLRTFLRAGYRLTDAETLEQDRHGRTRHFLNNLVGIVENDALVRIWGTQRDITERRQLENEARQVGRMETTGRLAGGIAHDFNNLLTAILGTSEILLQELPPNEPGRADVEEIKRAASRAADLTRQLLAFSRRQVLQPRILDLNRLVHGVETMLRRLIGEDISLETKKEVGLRLVKADPGQIEQVIVNLCVNARDAMPTGGTLRIETVNYDLTEGTQAVESAMPPGPYVLLTVIDTGTGMDAETLLNLFEPFFTTKEQGKGTGLGLATVYGIVKQSGGFIYADSGQGGSRFRIYLPAVVGSAEPPEAAEATVAPTRGEGTVLLVEDEEAVRRLTRRVLESAGYQVLEAPDGIKALALSESWTEELDLVITDVIMPGMSGQQLSARLREKRPWLKILYVSGYTDDAILQHGDLLPNTSFLHKPFSPSSLTQRVREVLGR